MEEVKNNSKTIWNIVILISIGIVLTMGYLIYDEYSSAKKDCESFDGEFEYKFPSTYFCDDKPFIRYSNGWDYIKEVNISEIVFP